MGYSYRVVDLSCEGAAIFDLYNKMLDQDIQADDIVIIWTHAFLRKGQEIEIDYKKINQHFDGKIWYWEIIGHPGVEGYRMISEKVFDKIRPAMCMETENYKFHVEKDLELKIEGFITELKNKLKGNQLYENVCSNAVSAEHGSRQLQAGAVVMNCNPFTYGHEYLIETASRLVDLLYVFVVEENKSVFPFSDRFDMVEQGTKQFENVIAMPSGEFMISTITFPGYFLKDSPTKECYDTFLDLKIFAHYIAPALGIRMRFVGEEPADRVTAQYNVDMKHILGDAGINVIEIPRKKYEEDVISAGRVCRLMKGGNYDVLGRYVPETTLKYLKNKNYKI